MKTAPALHLRLPARLASVEAARQAVLAHLAPLQPEPRLVYRVELVLEELVANQALHAHAAGTTSGEFELHVRTLPGPRVAIVVDDDGAPFDPTQPAPPPLAGAEAIGGRGLTLVRLHAETMHYERRAGHNRLRVEIAAR